MSSHHFHSRGLRPIGGEADPAACLRWRLDHAELVEMARRRRREILGGEYPKKPVKDGWLGPVPPEARDNEMTLLHNIRWFYPCRKGSLPPFRYDGAIDGWRKTVLAFSNDRIYIMQRDDPMSTPTETGHGSYLSIGDLIVVQYSSVGSLSDSIRVLQEPKQL